MILLYELISISDQIGGRKINKKIFIAHFIAPRPYCVLFFAYFFLIFYRNESQIKKYRYILIISRNVVARLTRHEWIYAEEVRHFIA